MNNLGKIWLTFCFIVMVGLFVFNGCKPKQNADDYTPIAQRGVEEVEEVEEIDKNKIVLKMLYDHHKEKDITSWVEIYSFEKNGMKYLIIQNQGDDWGHVVNLTKDSLEVKLIKRQLAKPDIE